MQDSQPQETPQKLQVKKWLFPFIEAALVVGFFVFVANISANPYSIPSSQTSFAAGPQLQYTCYTPGACPPGTGPTATPTQPPITLNPVTTVANPTVPPATRTDPSQNGSIAVNPEQGQPGTTVQVNGKGWQPTAPDGSSNKVTLVLDNASAGASGAISGLTLNNNAPVATLGTFAIAKDGSFQGTFVVPNVAAVRGQIVGTDLHNNRVSTPFSVQPSGASCPSVTSAQTLRIASRIENLSNNSYNVCIQVIAGADGVNLNDTVVINLPTGATVNDQIASLGSVSVNQNVVRWSGFSLAARQNATLSLTVNNGTANLNANSSMLVSGRFNQGQSFQQRINGLPPLFEIGAAPNNSGGQGGGQGGGAVVPEAAPASGQGKLAQAEQINPGLLIAGSLVILLALAGLGLRRLRRRH